METVYQLEVFSWFPKKDVTWGRGCVRVWGVTVAYVYPAEARIEGGRGALEV
jgi:hypothetical protein